MKMANWFCPAIQEPTRAGDAALLRLDEDVPGLQTRSAGAVFRERQQVPGEIDDRHQRAWRGAPDVLDHSRRDRENAACGQKFTLVLWTAVARQVSRGRDRRQQV